MTNNVLKKYVDQNISDLAEDMRIFAIATTPIWKGWLFKSYDPVDRVDFAEFEFFTTARNYDVVYAEEVLGTGSKNLPNGMIPEIKEELKSLGIDFKIENLQ